MGANSQKLALGLENISNSANGYFMQAGRTKESEASAG